MIAGDPALPEEKHSLRRVAPSPEKQPSGDRTGGVDEVLVRSRIALFDQRVDVWCAESAAAGAEFDEKGRRLWAEGGGMRRRMVVVVPVKHRRSGDRLFGFVTVPISVEINY